MRLCPLHLAYDNIVPLPGLWEKVLLEGRTDVPGMNYGHSPIVFQLMIIPYLTILIVLFIVSSRESDFDIPLVKTCTAAIAATCHASLKEDSFLTAMLSVS
jgi:hypothetical protein